MLDKVVNTIRQFNMLKVGDTIVVGVSGGADSVCLLDVLNSFKDEFKLNIIIVHINHNIRGEEADYDEEYVMSLAQKYNLQIKVFSYQCEELAKQNGLGTEEMGRILRYKAFNEVAGENGKIAVAHNINDNCETMLMNFLRGTGLKGLGGIPPVRDNIIRPLIAVTKAEIKAYCDENNLKYCTDSTNGDDSYTRNKMRLNIIPMLEQSVNKDISATMFRTANILRAEEEYIEKQAILAYNDCLVEKNRVNIPKLLSYDKVIQRRIIRIGFRDFLNDLHDISFNHVEAVLMLCYGDSGKSAELPQGLRAMREHDNLYFYKDENNVNGFCYEIPVDKKVRIEGQDISVLLTKCKKNEINEKLLFNIAFDCDKIDRKLCIRSRNTGDKIYLNGINGNKSIKKLFIELKIPRSQRDNIVMLAMDNEILWIKDYKTSDYYKASDTTANKLYFYVLGE